MFYVKIAALVYRNFCNRNLQFPGTRIKNPQDKTTNVKKKLIYVGTKTINNIQLFSIGKQGQKKKYSMTQKQLTKQSSYY